MKTMALGEILTDEQIEALLTIMETYRDDSIVRTRKMSEYLSQFRSTLEAKGVVPEYLSYAIEYQLMRRTT